MTEPKFSREVSANELKVSLEEPAVFTNRFFVLASPMFMRFAFAESYGDQVGIKPRGTFIMTHEDAFQFYNVLGETLKKVQENAVKGN